MQTSLFDLENRYASLSEAGVPQNAGRGIKAAEISPKATMPERKNGRTLTKNHYGIRKSQK